MTLWKQAQQQPFNTYRDPQTGQWTVVNPSQPLQDIIVEAPVYRDPETGRWITAKSSLQNI
ncbi:hypothetical protein H6F98_09915 [Microcoleus sp. FACHB-SPT15]|jgi:hypothetical protein|uniref:hypothetical protein n=1 Tax=Microcoleus sp. FACHB-SPT15 TaxID=2692830 RepID=UPI001782CC2F|nr:hypothetical protein [Microcoleus sp. FACHB-SPT15]MBD1805764.1 hypothetical protein [Microcoleus sp. FACHB-SPT15]